MIPTELDDLHDDDDLGQDSWESANPSQTDSFYNDNPEVPSSSRVDRYYEEEEKEDLDPEDDWIYNDLFAGTNKKPYREEEEYQHNPRWDKYKL